jgi:hypothetical protein
MRSRNIILVASVLLLAGCEKKKDAPPPMRDEDNPIMKLPEAVSQTEDGLYSFKFTIEKFTDPKQYGQGATFMTIAARHKSMPMRFDITVGRHGVPFTNPGGGDQFYRELGDLFGIKPQPPAMRASTQFDHEVLEGDPTELEKGPAKLLVKHRNGARFQMIVDMQKKTVEIREIDKKYRQQIMDAFKIT